ncbi:oxidoreductase [Iodidimonas muriae]|uniref:Oxidoreductase n=1 Tax=Iodidimonas muriae TaxID=261467 RepID=A0ABQ2LFS6_9PROT|nr:SDR family oxidoreductase [Iodidimonas muriae]GER08625.1 oxidoreductase [Kordiimonadales bacterium JCM 17843]GGO15769.1 oxidoreductase [Iodidimonas muriae]
MQFEKKVVWITGASSGIGEALAKVLAKRGAKLILSARREDELNRVRTEIIKAGGDGDQYVVLPFDALDEAALDDVVARAKDAFGHIDLLVNNAGISQRSMAVDTDMAVYRKVMELDFFAPISLTQKVLPIMLAQGSGHVAVTASVAGKIGVQLRTGYCAAKHAVMGYFDALRAELAAENIAVTTIVPGFIQTNISTYALKGDATPFGRQTESIAGGMDVMAAAEVIARGFERGKPEISVGKGREMQALWLKRLAPRLLFKMMASVRAE